LEDTSNIAAVACLFDTPTWIEKFHCLYLLLTYLTTLQIT